MTANEEKNVTKSTKRKKYSRIAKCRSVTVNFDEEKIICGNDYK